MANIGDRVKWASQAAGSWKIKVGNVIDVSEKNYTVEVDTVIAINDNCEPVGEPKVLKKKKVYFPRKGMIGNCED